MLSQEYLHFTFNYIAIITTTHIISSACTLLQRLTSYINTQVNEPVYMNPSIRCTAKSSGAWQLRHDCL